MKRGIRCTKVHKKSIQCLAETRLFDGKLQNLRTSLTRKEDITLTPIVYCRRTAGLEATGLAQRHGRPEKAQ